MVTPPPGDRAGEQAHGWKYEQRVMGPSGTMIYASSNIHIFQLESLILAQNERWRRA